jgi:hypothetical protein
MEVADRDRKGSTTGQTKKVFKVYPISRFSGSKGRILLNQIFNKLPTVGKKKQLDVQPFEGEDPLGVNSQDNPLDLDL